MSIYESQPLVNPSMAEIHLPYELGSRLLQVALELQGSPYDPSFQKRGDFIESTDPITQILSGSVVGPYLDRMHNGSLVGLTIHGLPQDLRLGPAPLDGGRPSPDKTLVSERLAVGIARTLGYPSIILGEKNEELVHQITPVAGKELSQSNEGQVDLMLHQDLAPNPELMRLPYDLAMPDWLILTGVQRGSGHTPTYIAPVDEAIRRMSDSSLEILEQERFVTNPPESFLSAMESTGMQPPVHSILSLSKNVESVFDTSSNVRPAAGAEDVEAALAIDEYNQALGAVKREVTIDPGTAVVFNNRRVVHGRGPVAQESNLAKKRWIQRVYVFEPQRFVDIALTSPVLTVQIGGGILRVAPGYNPVSERILELANN